MRGAIFDWDGTLASIDEREFYCINLALTGQGAKPISKEFYINNYYRRAYELGTGPRMVLETALADHDPPIRDRAYDTYRTSFQRTTEKATLQKGAIEILGTLKQQGFKTGIATMRYTRRTVQQELDHLSVSPLVDLLKTRQDLGVSGTLKSLEETVNQRVQLVERELTELHLRTSDAFLVGDSWWDIRAGKRLGVKTVLVKTGFAAFNDFSRESPDVTVQSLADLEAELQARDWSL